jgi:hypothetical protein
MGEALGQFCFPAPQSRELTPNTRFSFCLTSQDAVPTYGYVQYAANPLGISAFCLLSRFFNPDAYFSIISQYQEKIQTNGDWMGVLRDNLRPRLKQNLEGRIEQQQIVKNCVAFAFRIMNIHSISEILTAVLLSRRIVITSEKIETMERFCFALLAMVYPLAWPGVFIPVLPSTVVETIYAPFQYIIGLHASLLSHAQVPEMDSYVLVLLDEKKVRHINPPYKIPPHIQKEITKFEGAVADHGLGKGFREFIISLIAYVLKTDPHDPSTLAAAYKEMASALSDQKQNFEASILESQFVSQLMKEAEAGPGSEVHAAFWGAESEILLQPSRPPVPVPAAPSIGETWDEILHKAQMIGSGLTRQRSIDQTLQQRRTATMITRVPLHIEDGPLDMKSRIAFFQGGERPPARPRLFDPPEKPPQQGAKEKGKSKGLLGWLKPMTPKG